MKNVFVIAGGPSVKDYDLSKLDGLGYKLGINDSVFYTDCQGVVSMDRTWIEKRKDKLRKMPVSCYFSKKHFSKAFGEPWDKVSLHLVDIEQKGMSKNPDKLQAKNSGFLGVNLVYQWKPTNVFLFGFDLNLSKTGLEHWHPDYEWRKKKEHNGLYHTWIKDHEIAAKQFKEAKINVYNVNNCSKITAYEIIKFDDIFKHL